MKGPGRATVTGGTAIYETGPDRVGYLPRYILALTAPALFAVSVITMNLMRDYLGDFSPSMGGPVGALLPGMGDLVEISILLTAPVGIYLTFVVIGWMVRSVEIWAGSALALGLAGLAGFVLVSLSPYPSVNPALGLLYQIADLIGPASLAAMVIILSWIEFSRRSIWYGITDEGVILRGGIWKLREHMIPWHQIGRLVLEQNPFEKVFNTGTVIPVGTGSPVPAAGRKGAGKPGEELSRDPLDCLAGIRDPELVMALLQKLASQSSGGTVAPGSYP